MSGIDDQRTIETSKKPQDERQMTIEGLIEHCKAKGLSLVPDSDIAQQKPANEE